MNQGWNMVLMSVFCSYLQKFTPVLMMTACLRLINQSQDFVMIVVTFQKMYLEYSSNIQTISGILHQLMDPRGEYFEITDVQMDVKD